MLVVHVDLLMLRLMLMIIIINIFIIDPTVCAYSVTKMGAFCYNCSAPRCMGQRKLYYLEDLQLIRDYQYGWSEFGSKTILRLVEATTI